MWNDYSDEYQQRHDPLIGRAPKLWGMFAVPDASIGALGDTRGLDVLELGCGGGQWTASLEAEGARVVGLDISEAQLASARTRTGAPLVQASAEQVPLRGASFDVVFCDHGAMTWGNPLATLPQVARILRPGGRLLFNIASPWFAAAYDDDRDVLGATLHGDYFDAFRYEETPEGAATYNPTYGAWIRLFRTHGFVVEDLIEIRPPVGATSTYVTADPPDWPHRWPVESLWVARRT